jgi:hypothetical protein
LLQDLPVDASIFPDLISSSETEISMTAAQENDFSAAAQIGRHATVNSPLVSSSMISVEVVGAQGIVLMNGKSDSLAEADFAWTCGGNPAISHVKVIARGNSEVHMVIFTLSMAG